MTLLVVATDGFRGEASESFAGVDLASAVRTLTNPGSASATVHWGRNYLYRVRLELGGAPVEVVVKQFRDRGWRARWARRGSGCKAERSFRGARALAAVDVATPEPLLWLEGEAEGGSGVSLFVCRWLPGRIEARFLLRARNTGAEREEFPGLDFDAFLAAAAATARRLHDGGIWHRDYSAGNLLILPGPSPSSIAELAVVDLNRVRLRERVALGERMRDLARLPLERVGDRQRLLELYFGARPSALARLRYELARLGFHGRHRLKGRLRAWAGAVKSWLVPRGVHAHIPPPPAGAGARDKIVWDRLSDQPHSHAGRLERARIRIGDAGDHLKSLAALLGALPAIHRQYRLLATPAGRAPFAWPGVGVALRPWPDDPGALLTLVDELGVSQVLLRLHPWQENHDAEEELARALAERGIELTFTLPQSRELVRDRARWRQAVSGLAHRFTPYGRRFQIGQAINRSKWGVWNYGDYLELAGEAARILRAYPDVELAGPAVIDFEAHVTAAVLNRRRPGLQFDALASLLYVDRRGAPEKRQLGFDAVGKVTLLAAIAESSRLLGQRRHWITEINWPLAEGPHSPAGRSVAVDEESQADYLARFYLLVLGTGLVERVFWWQLVAKGYGLVDPSTDGSLRRRPAFAALATLGALVPAGSVAHPALPAPPGAHLYRFDLRQGGALLAGWSSVGRQTVTLAARPLELLGRSGERLPAPAGHEVVLDGSVRYIRI